MAKNEARVDVAARDLWTHGQKALFDVKVFNPLQSPIRSVLLHRASLTMNNRRREPTSREYLRLFTPLVFSTTGGKGRLAFIFYSRLAKMLSEKRQQPFSTMMG